MNRNLLEYEMKKKNITPKDMCRFLNISRSAWYRKTHEISQFTQREIKGICIVLELETPVDIFFADEVS